MISVKSLARHYVTTTMSDTMFRTLSNPLNKLSDVIFNRINTAGNKYIFVMSTGRCGTLSLETIMRSVKDSVCYHEPPPQMSYMQLSNITNFDYYNFLFKCIKRFSIERRLGKSKCYCETNHLFNKTFAEFSIEQYQDNIRLIHLYRDPVRVAYSYYSKMIIPGEPGPGTFWCLAPKDDSNRLKISDVLYRKEFSHDFYKILWYWYECETRTKEIKSRFPDTIVYTLQTEDLNNYDIISNMLDTFNVEYNSEMLLTNIGTHINKKPDNVKNENFEPLSSDQKNEMHGKFLDVLTERYGPDFWIS